MTQRQGPENVGEQGPPPRAWVASHYVREFADGVNEVVDDVMPSTEPVPGSRWSELIKRPRSRGRANSVAWCGSKGITSWWGCPTS